MSEVYSHRQVFGSTVTTLLLASACHTVILLPHWKVFVTTVTTLASVSVLLPHWQVYVRNVTHW